MDSFYKLSNRLKLAALLKLRGDGLANLEQTLGLRATAAKVGVVPGEPTAGVDVEGDFCVRVSGEVHCGVSVQKIELTVWSAVRLLLPLSLTSPTQARMRCQSRAAVPCKLITRQLGLQCCPSVHGRKAVPEKSVRGYWPRGVWDTFGDSGGCYAEVWRIYCH